MSELFLPPWLVAYFAILVLQLVLRFFKGFARIMVLFTFQGSTRRRILLVRL